MTLVLLLVVVCVLAPVARAANPPGAYLSIFGADGNDGLTQATAVKTLARAFAGAAGRVRAAFFSFFSIVWSRRRVDRQ